MQHALSTWGHAIVAAATGDSVMMAALLRGEHDDGNGVHLRTYRTSWADVDFLLEAKNIRIEPHYTLVEVAIERDHFDVVMILTEEPQQADPQTVEEPPRLHRAVSTFSPGNLADVVREQMASQIHLVTDGPLCGLPRVLLQHRQTFLLSREAVELTVDARLAACGMLLEDPYTQEGVDAAVAWWAQLIGERLGVHSSEFTLPRWALPALYASLRCPLYPYAAWTTCMHAYMQVGSARPVHLGRWQLPPPRDDARNAWGA